AATVQQTPVQLPGQVGNAMAPSAQSSQSRSNMQFLEFRALSNLTRVTGVARDRSFLTAGNNNAVDLSYLEDWGLGTHQVELLSTFRYTDDARIDPEHSSVQRAYLRISSPRSEYNFGDYLVSYSRLTYNQNLKGFHFVRQVSWGRGFRLMGNAG